MAVPEEKFRLGDMLSLTLRAPLSFRWPVTEDRAMKLVAYLTDGHMDPFRMEDMLALCDRELRRQHPWLAGVKIPTHVRNSRSWPTLWAWLDKMECKHGTWHPVSAISNADEIAAPVIELVVDFSSLPPSVQEMLRQMGIDPDS